MLKQAAAAQARAEQLVAIVETARGEVIEAYDAVRERQVDAATEKMSIETLKEVTANGGRLDALPEHGYYTVAEFRRMCRWKTPRGKCFLRRSGGSAPSTP